MTDQRVDVVMAVLGTDWRHKFANESMAKAILAALDQRAVTSKWDEPRKELMERATGCWIPHAELVKELNKLPGPPVTEGDIRAAIIEYNKSYHSTQYRGPSYDDGDLDHQAGCLTVFTRELQLGTGFDAIITLINEEVIQPATRAMWAAEAAAERQRKLSVVRSGNDFRFMRGITETDDFYGRLNGQLYRIETVGNRQAPYKVFCVKAVGEVGEPASPHTFAKYLDLVAAWNSKTLHRSTLKRK